MNKKKILKLFSGLSSVAMLATSSLILTSCSANNNDDNFTNGFVKPLNIRFLPSSRLTYPIYALPKQNPYFMAPNFKVMNIINGTPLNDDVVIDPDTGWPDINSLKLMTYQQFFMNDKVAQEMSPTGSEKEPIGVDGFKTLAKFRHDTAEKSTLNLKNAYKYDDYADETIKAFNCPYFYNAYEISSGVFASVYSSIRKIDLSENNLWYLPFFGYNANAYDPIIEASHYIMRAQQIPEGETNPVKMGFVNLGLNTDGSTVMPGTIIDLSGNQLTLLPFADDVDTGTYDILGNKIYENYDLTSLLIDPDETLQWTNAIAVDGNCFGYDLKDTGVLANFTKYRKYQNINAIEFSTDTEGKGYQSYAIYTNKERMYDEVVWKCSEALNETVDQFKKRSLDSIVPEVQKLSSVLGSSDEQYPLGACLNQLIAEYLSNNGLCSAYIYTNYEISLGILVQAFSNSDYIYDYANYSSNSGCLTFSLQLGTPRECIKEGDFYVNKYATGQGSYFIAFTVYGFDATHYMAIIVAIICALVGAALIFVILYYTFIRKHIAAKKKIKDIEAISSITKSQKKGGK